MKTEIENEIFLSVPEIMFTSQTYALSILDYDEKEKYDVSVSSGVFDRKDNTIFFTTPDKKGEVILTITSNDKTKKYVLNIEENSVKTPEIISPKNNSFDISLLPVIKSSAFNFNGVYQEHVASHWQISKDSMFVNKVADSGETTEYLTSWIPNTILNTDTTYYVRVRHKGSVTGWSNWSYNTISGFKTIEEKSFIAQVGATNYVEFKSIVSTIEDDKVYIYSVGYARIFDESYLHDSVITKFDISGNIIWQKRLGGPYNEEFKHIISTVENGKVFLYVIGNESTSSGGFYKALITKWDTEGNLIWQRNIGSLFDSYFNHIVSTVENNKVYLYTVGYVTLDDNKKYAAFIAKWDAYGNLIWLKELHDYDNICFNSITFSKENNKIYLYVAGYKKINNSKKIVQGFIIKLDNEGKLIWQKKLSETNSIYIESITSTIENNKPYLYIAGSYIVGNETSPNDNNFNNSIVIKLNNEGNVVWQKHLEYRCINLITSIVSIKDNDTIYLYTSGYIWVDEKRCYEAIIIKWNTEGDIIQHSKVGNFSNNYSDCIISTVKNNLVYMYSFIPDINNVYRMEVKKWYSFKFIPSRPLYETYDIFSSIVTLKTFSENFITRDSDFKISNSNLIIFNPNLPVKDIHLTLFNKNKE